MAAPFELGFDPKLAAEGGKVVVYYDGRVWKVYNLHYTPSEIMIRHTITLQHAFDLLQREEARLVKELREKTISHTDPYNTKADLKATIAALDLVYQARELREDLPIES